MFRTVEDLLILFLIGIGFSLAFKLSDNNLMVAYFVNLPNAFLTYILKSKQFPVFTEATSIYAAITIIVVIMMIMYFVRKSKVKVIK